MRYRPNGSNRHDLFILDDSEGNDDFNFTNPTDLEWMSLNYRKERAAKLSKSKRRIILIMF